MTDAASAVSSSPAAPGRRKTLLLRIVAGLALAGAAYGAWWGLVARHYQHTDNAYVGGNLVQITPQTSGTVLSILADDTDFVAAGQPLVKLDPADAEVALAQAEADLAQQVRQSRALFANRAASAALLAQRQSELSRAEDDLKRRQAAGGEAVAGEELAHASAAVANARAALSAAKEQLAASEAQTENTRPDSHPAVARAAARVRESYLALSRATLPAPVAGYVAKRGVQVGQRVQPGAPLMAIVPLNSLWVDANFKESQLAGMRIGQPVTLHADIYGGSVTYHGKVAGQGGNGVALQGDLLGQRQRLLPGGGGLALCGGQLAGMGQAGALALAQQRGGALGAGLAFASQIGQRVQPLQPPISVGQRGGQQ